MDVTTFYAVFSATCFTLVGLWWGVTTREMSWVGDPARRGEIGEVYLAFLLPALMGLFAQVGSVDEPMIWRVSFIVIAVAGCAATLRRFSTDTDPALMTVRGATAAIYVLVALIGLVPSAAGTVGLRPIQVAALLLVLLVALGHALVWRFLVRDHLARG